MIGEEKAGGRLTHKRYNWLGPLNVSFCVMIGEDKAGGERNVGGRLTHKSFSERIGGNS